MNLHQRAQAQLERQGMQRRQLVVVQRGGDEQYRIGPHQRRVVHIGRAYGEVLAKHRDADRGPGGLEVGGRACEVLDVGEHAEAGSATVLVPGRPHGRVEVRVQCAFGR